MNRKTLWTLFGTLVLAAGCASVQVRAPKEPIKMDISMRLDVYQHVVKDIDNIESIVAGGAKTAWLGNLFVGTAYAAETGLPAEATEAAYRRRDRKGSLDAYIAQGALAEGADALVGSGRLRRRRRAAARAGRKLRSHDHLRAIAQKNGSSTEEVQKVYAKKLRG